MSNDTVEIDCTNCDDDGNVTLRHGKHVTVIKCGVCKGEKKVTIIAGTQ